MTTTLPVSNTILVMQGVIVYFRVVDGEMRVGDTVKLINTGKEHQIDELGVLAPKPIQVHQGIYGLHSQAYILRLTFSVFHLTFTICKRSKYMLLF